MNTPKDDRFLPAPVRGQPAEGSRAVPNYGWARSAETGVSGVMAKEVNIQITLKDPDHCIATWHQTVIEVWRGVPTATGVRHMMKTCEKLLATGRGDVTYLAIVERSSPAPPERVRPVLAQWSREIVPRMAGAVIVAEGGGFRSALVRGVGIALTALLPHKIPFKFSGTLDEGANLLASFVPASVGGVTALRAAAEKVHAEMDNQQL